MLPCLAAAALAPGGSRVALVQGVGAQSPAVAVLDLDTTQRRTVSGLAASSVAWMPDGESLLEIPLTAGVVAGGAVTIMAPVLAAVGALAALLSEFKVEVIRTDQQDDENDD